MDDSKKSAAEKVAEESRLKSLEDIARSIRRVDQPLLPVSFLFSLRIPILQTDFAQYEDSNLFTLKFFQSFIKSVPKSEQEFRLQLPSAYVDVKDSAPVAAGTYIMESPNLVTAHEECSKRYIRLGGNDLFEGLRDGRIPENILHQPISMKIVIQSSVGAGDSLTLRGKTDGFQPSGLVVMDEVLFVFFQIDAGDIKSSSEKIWGFQDLNGAKVKIELQYLFLDGFSNHPEDELRSVMLHNFQIICGEGGKRNFALTKEMIANQVWKESDDIQFAKPSMQLSLTVNESISTSDFEANSRHSS